MKAKLIREHNKTVGNMHHIGDGNIDRKTLLQRNEYVQNGSVTEDEEEHGEIATQEIVDRLLIELELKRYQLKIEKYLGVYCITLPTTGIALNGIRILGDVLPEGSVVGVYPDLFSGLTIKTPYKVDN